MVMTRKMNPRPSKHIGKAIARVVLAGAAALTLAGALGAGTAAADIPPQHPACPDYPASPVLPPTGEHWVRPLP